MYPHRHLAPPSFSATLTSATLTGVTLTSATLIQRRPQLSPPLLGTTLTWHYPYLAPVESVKGNAAVYIDHFNLQPDSIQRHIMRWQCIRFEAGVCQHWSLLPSDVRQSPCRFIEERGRIMRKIPSKECAEPRTLTFQVKSIKPNDPF